MSSIFDENIFIPKLSKFSFAFPSPREAGSEGLLAYGGGLEPSRLLTAYKKGIFPWYSKDDPILWWSPNPRLVLYPKDFKVKKSFRKILRSSKFIVKFDHNFRQTIKICAKIREGNEETWLIKDMQDAYIELHNMGFAHSVEVYEDDEFIGGLYGIAIGKAFCGESMVSLKPNASKVALKALSDILKEQNYKFIDCQVQTDHLQSLGAVLIDRDIFLDQLEVAMQKCADIGSWRDYRWKYKDG